jgi:DNA-binding CsgD family transcriptional regulator
MLQLTKKNAPTVRELEVLRHIAVGETLESTAKKLYISPDTSKMRMKTLREKLNAATSAEAVYKALKWNLIE